jgi:hypothetical protein
MNTHKAINQSCHVYVLHGTTKELEISATSYLPIAIAMFPPVVASDMSSRFLRSMFSGSASKMDEQATMLDETLSQERSTTGKSITLLVLKYLSRFSLLFTKNIKCLKMNEVLPIS